MNNSKAALARSLGISPQLLRYRTLKDDPEFKRKRAVSSKKYRMKNDDKISARRDAWDLANPERARERKNRAQKAYQKRKKERKEAVTCSVA